MTYAIETDGIEAPDRREDCERYLRCLDLAARTRVHQVPKRQGQGWDGMDCPADCAGYKGA